MPNFFSEIILPSELIAKYPPQDRADSRMLVYQKHYQDDIEHKNFRDIIDYLNPGDILVRNNSKVLPARLDLKSETGAEIEILLLNNIGKQTWKALAKPAKRIKSGRKYFLADGTILELSREHEEEILVKFNSDEHFQRVINQFGSMPIPPYMRRAGEEIDKDRYQTIYAKDSDSGLSVAAPTAGLHFSEEINLALEKKNIEFVDLTLHVGLGTFLPISTDDYHSHKMHAEYYEILDSAYQKILQAKKQSRRIIAVGTTSVRTLESIALTGNLCGKTEIFIYPGFDFKIIDGLLTNFHLPNSTLILLVAAFIGEEKTKSIYKEAINKKYRFYSYGDCCLFL